MLGCPFREFHQEGCLEEAARLLTVLLIQAEVFMANAHRTQFVGKPKLPSADMQLNCAPP